MRRWLMNSTIIHRDFQKEGFPQLCEQGDIFSQINDIMTYARGKHTQLTMIEGCTLKSRLGSTINV